jgi:2,4-dienoyl-CoA reductase-like NADH-dependent reductase (Old Yellow Enzyme family)
MPTLFDPLKLGAVPLQNRIVMAPLTRTRAAPGRVPNQLMRHYYHQRSSAGLILTEATSISPQGVGYYNTPGIWSHAQVEGWRNITAAVHERGSKIFLQLWHVGRVSDPEHLNGEIPVAPSAIACEGHVSQLRPQRPYVVPRALRADELPGIVNDYAQAARHAREAGFDGVEVHAANGYLIDQFLHSGSNQRTDAYGGSVANRARLLLEVVDGCAAVWGPDRVGVHLSPGGGVHSMRDANPGELFRYVAIELGRRRLAFVFVREAWGPQSLLPDIKHLFGGPVIANQDMDASVGAQLLEQGVADAIAFGRAFIANPDLPRRLSAGGPFNAPDSSSFYGDGPEGYTDYPALPEEA